MPPRAARITRHGVLNDRVKDITKIMIERTGDERRATRASGQPPALPPYLGDDYGNILRKLTSSVHISKHRAITKLGLCGRIDPEKMCYGINGECCVAYEPPNAPHIEDELRARQVVGFKLDANGQPTIRAVENKWCAFCDEIALAGIDCPGLRFPVRGRAEEIPVPCTSRKPDTKIELRQIEGQSRVVAKGRDPCCNSCAQLYRTALAIKRGGMKKRSMAPLHGNLSRLQGQQVRPLVDKWKNIVILKTISRHSCLPEREPTKPHDLFHKTRGLVCYVCGLSFSSTIHTNTGDANSDASDKHTKEAVFSLRVHADCELWLRNRAKDIMKHDVNSTDDDVAARVLTEAKTRAEKMTPEISRKFMMLKTNTEKFSTTRVSRHAKNTSLVDSYSLTGDGPKRFAFNFVRCSSKNFDNVREHFFSLNDMAFLAAKQYSTGQPVLPGEGPVVLIPDRYFKVGPACHSLVPSEAPLNVAWYNPKINAQVLAFGSNRTGPNFEQLLSDARQLLSLHASNTVSIVIDAPITLGGDVQHLIYAFSEVPEEFWPRIFLVTKKTSTARPGSTVDSQNSETLIREADWRDTNRQTFGVVTCGVQALMTTLKSAPSKLNHFDTHVGKFLEVLYYEQFVATHRAVDHTRHVQLARKLPDSQVEGLVSQPRTVEVSGAVMDDSTLADSALQTRDIFVCSVGREPIRAQAKVVGERQRVFFGDEVLKTIVRHRVDRWTLASNFNKDQPIDSDDNDEDEDDDEEDDEEADAEADDNDDDDPPLVHAPPIRETLSDFLPMSQHETPSWGDLDENMLDDLTATLTSEARGA